MPPQRSGQHPDDPDASWVGKTPDSVENPWRLWTTARYVWAGSVENRGLAVEVP